MAGSGWRESERKGRGRGGREQLVPTYDGDLTWGG